MLLFCCSEICVLVVCRLLLLVHDDDSPALSHISETLRLSPDVAGITILAFGNGSADVFSIFAAVQQGKFDIALNEITGSGCYVTMVVVAAIGLVSVAQLNRVSFVRDIILYFGAAAFAFVTTFDGQITLVESIGLIVYYVLYVTFVIASGYIKRWYVRRYATPKDEALLTARGDGDSTTTNSDTDAYRSSVSNDGEIVQLRSTDDTLSGTTSSSRTASSSRLGWSSSHNDVTPRLAVANASTLAVPTPTTSTSKKPKRSTAARVIDPLYSDADQYLHTTDLPHDDLVSSIADGVDIGNNNSYDSAPSLPRLSNDPAFALFHRNRTQQHDDNDDDAHNDESAHVELKTTPPRTDSQTKSTTTTSTSTTTATSTASNLAVPLASQPMLIAVGSARRPRAASVGAGYLNFIVIHVTLTDLTICVLVICV